MRAGLRALCLVLAGAALWLQAATAAAEAADLTIAVAPFEAVGPPGDPLPDAAQLLADRLGTRGVGRVVGPTQLGGPATAEPSPEQVQRWARGAEVEHIVVGRSTRIGRSLSFDLRLRDGRDGQVVSTYVAEVAGEGELEAAIDGLASRILGGAASAPAAGPKVAAAAPVSAGVPAARAAAETEAGEASKPDKPSGFFGLSGDSDAPMSIQSDELEAFQGGEGRQFIFRRNVRVTQGAMRLRANRLEAYYPPEGSQPDRLVATGRVVLQQENQSARCDKATYLRTEGRVICEGEPGELRQGEDHLRCREIEFFLESEKLLCRGGADVRLQSSDDGDGQGS